MPSPEYRVQSFWLTCWKLKQRQEAWRQRLIALRAACKPAAVKEILAHAKQILS
jgi:hypothetical protein